MPSRDRGILAANLLSSSRIALCLPLLLVDAMTMPFWVLYVIAGTTDMLDGFVPIIPYRPCRKTSLRYR